MAETFESLVQRRDQLQRQLDEIEAVERMADLFEEVEQAMAQLKNALNGMSKDAATVSGKIEDAKGKVNEAMEALDLAQSKLTEAVETLSDAAGEVAKGVSAFGKKTGELAKKLEELEAAKDKVKDLMDAFDGDTGAIFRAFNDYLSAIASKLGPLVARIPGLGTFLAIWLKGIEGIGVSAAALDAEVVARNAGWNEAFGDMMPIDIYRRRRTREQRRQDEKERLQREIERLEQQIEDHPDNPGPQPEPPSASGKAHTDVKAAEQNAHRSLGTSPQDMERARSELSWARWRLRQAWQRLKELEAALDVLRRFELRQAENLVAVRQQALDRARQTRTITGASNPEVELADAQARLNTLRIQEQMLEERIRETERELQELLEDYEQKLEPVQQLNDRVRDTLRRHSKEADGNFLREHYPWYGQWDYWLPRDRTLPRQPLLDLDAIRRRVGRGDDQIGQAMPPGGVNKVLVGGGVAALVLVVGLVALLGMPAGTPPAEPPAKPAVPDAGAQAVIPAPGGPGEPQATQPVAAAGTLCIEPSLQTCIDAAQPGDLVLIPPGTHQGTLAIDKPLTLMGDPDNPGSTILDGGGAGPVIALAPPPGVLPTGPGPMIDGLTIQNGHAAQGGGIWLDRWPDATIQNSVIGGNHAEEHGGGIFIQNAAGLQFLNNRVEHNTALGNGGGFYQFDSYNTFFNGNNVIGNSARLHGGGLFQGSGQSFVVPPDYQWWMDVGGTTFGENTAVCNGGGAAITVSGSRWQDTLFADNVSSNAYTFISVTNVTTGAEEVTLTFCNGGGMHVAQTTSTLAPGATWTFHTSNMTFDGNRAEGDGSAIFFGDLSPGTQHTWTVGGSADPPDVSPWGAVVFNNNLAGFTLGWHVDGGGVPGEPASLEVLPGSAVSVGPGWQIQDDRGNTGTVDDLQSGGAFAQNSPQDMVVRAEGWADAALSLADILFPSAQARDVPRPEPTPTQEPVRRIGPILATFVPESQLTNYRVEGLEPGFAYYVGWSGPDCGEWNPQGWSLMGSESVPGMEWFHPHPDCDPTTDHSHVTVQLQLYSLQRGRWLTTTCEYQGAASGRGPSCDDSGGLPVAR